MQREERDLFVLSVVCAVRTRVLRVVYWRCIVLQRASESEWRVEWREQFVLSKIA